MSAGMAQFAPVLNAKLVGLMADVPPMLRMLSVYPNEGFPRERRR